MSQCTCMSMLLLHSRPPRGVVACLRLCCFPRKQTCDFVADVYAVWTRVVCSTWLLSKLGSMCVIGGETLIDADNWVVDSPLGETSPRIKHGCQ